MNANAQPNPYAPPQVEVRDTGAPSVVVPASRLSRLGAALLDAFIGFLVGLPIIVALLPSLIRANGDASVAIGAMSGDGFTRASILSVVLAIAWAVVTFILVKRNSQTIGKKIVGIKVVRANGQHASLARIFWLRNVVNLLPSMIPLLGGFYGLIDHLLIFGGKRQCIHDKIADTIVVKA